MKIIWNEKKKLNVLINKCPLWLSAKYEVLGNIEYNVFVSQILPERWRKQFVFSRPVSGTSSHDVSLGSLRNLLTRLFYLFEVLARHRRGNTIPGDLNALFACLPHDNSMEFSLLALSNILTYACLYFGT